MVKPKYQIDANVDEKLKMVSLSRSSQFVIGFIA
jgi:hypothetical protein